MNREVLIALINKDVVELGKLTCGFSAMSEFPAPYMELAIDKAKALVDNLVALSVAAGGPKLSVEADECVVATAGCADEEVNEPVAACEDECVPPVEEEMEREEMPVVESVPQHEEVEIAPVEDVTEEEPESEDESDVMAEEEFDNEEAEEIAVEEEEAEPEPAPLTDGLEEAEEEEEVTVNAVAVERDGVATVQSVQQQVTTVADAIKGAESLLDSLSKEQDNTIAASMAMKKITDLKSALTIADRFRFQRELFGGDGEKMMQALSDFNAMGSMAEAQEYIGAKLSWRMDSPCVETFMALLERRYM